MQISPILSDVSALTVVTSGFATRALVKFAIDAAVFPSHPRQHCTSNRSDRHKCAGSRSLAIRSLLPVWYLLLLHVLFESGVRNRPICVWSFPTRLLETRASSSPLSAAAKNSSLTHFRGFEMFLLATNSLDSSSSPASSYFLSSSSSAARFCSFSRLQPSSHLSIYSRPGFFLGESLGHVDCLLCASAALTTLDWAVSQASEGCERLRRSGRGASSCFRGPCAPSIMNRRGSSSSVTTLDRSK